MRKEIQPDFGFQAPATGPRRGLGRKLEAIGVNAVRRKFSPEFINRVDAVIAYQPLDAVSLTEILDQQIEALERHIENRLAERAFDLEVSPSARQFLLEKGASQEYGARELKRTILRHLTQPLAAMLAADSIEPGALVRADPSPTGDRLTLIVHSE